MSKTLLTSCKLAIICVVVQFASLSSTVKAQNASFDAGSNLMLVGDSFTNGSTEWARRIDFSSEFSMDFFSAGGRTLSSMATLFPDQYQDDTYDAVVIAGGLNDVLGNRSLVQIQASINSIISQTNGEHIILTTIPPFGGRSDLSTADRQEVAEQVDAWIFSLAENSTNISVFDIGKVMDANDDQIIDAELTSADLLHPGICNLNQTCGSSVIADAFISEFLLIPGDVNRDDEISFLDISPFVLLLVTRDYQREADIDRSESINFLDISPFVGILSGN